MTDVLIQNEIKCNSCGDIIYSAHRHDFKNCKCGLVAVDGGLDYLRRAGSLRDWTERSVWIDRNTLKSCVEAVELATKTGRNSLGVVFAVMRTLKDSGELK